jgi:hypothetical protein
VTATDRLCGNTAGVVAAALAVKALGQRLDRLSAMKARTINDDQLALARDVGL